MDHPTQEPPADPTRRTVVAFGCRLAFALPTLAATGYGNALLAGKGRSVADGSTGAAGTDRPVLRAATFGVAGDGRSDDTRELQAAADAAAGRVLLIEGVCQVGATILLPNDVTVRFAPGAALVATKGNFSILKASGRSGVMIVGGRFRGAAGDAPYVGGVLLESCSGCLVLDCTFEAMQWAGVYLENTHDSTVAGNRFLAARPSRTDSSDICVYKNSSRNLLSGNMSSSGAHVGVLVQDPGGRGLYSPQDNRVVGNHLTGNSVYGICLYVGGADCRCEISGNEIEGVTGADYPSGGAGIYCVGKGLGGAVIRDNIVRNCCQLTRDRLNGPAGISVGGFDGGEDAAAPIVRGNRVEAMAQGDGIHVVSCRGGAALKANLVVLPAANAGSGAGGATLVGNALRIQNSSHVTVVGGSYTAEGKGDAVLVLATAARITDIRIEGVVSRGARSAAVRTGVEAGLKLIRLTIRNCHATAGGRADALQLQGVESGSVAGNVLSSAQGRALLVAGCRHTRIIANRLTSGGPTLAAFTGDCSGSRVELEAGVPRSAIANWAKGLIVASRSSDSA